MRSSTFFGLLATLATLTVAVPVNQPAPLDNTINPAFPYGSTQVRGVNLGGWLVLEPWITPSLFDATNNQNIVDEWTFGQLQSSSVARAALTKHWDTWITQSDFAAIAAAGLNHVRLPIGYWAFDVSNGEPYVQGQLPYLTKAVSWAKTYGLKVIVDLHGTPGSQNGYDNSGHRVGSPAWQTNSSNIQRTDTIIQTLANMYKDDTTVTVIAPINEPAGWFGDSLLTPLKQFYYDSYGSVRFPYGSSQQSNTLLLLHDAFMDLSYWNSFMGQPQWQGVAMDTHIYQVFSNSDVAMTQAQHISSACSQQSKLSSFNGHLWTIVGEWSPAITDCATALNGRGRGARYDGSMSGSPYVGSCTGMTGSGSGFSSSYKTFLRKYWEAQVQSYEKGGEGWIMWCWKNENASDWSYQDGLKYGWIPSNPTSYQYPNICG